MKFLERFWFGCGHCHGGHGCPVGESADPETGEIRLAIAGPALVGTVMLVFLVPLITAIGGAYLARHYPPPGLGAWGGWCEVAGGLAGFFVGVGVARLVLWACRREAPADGGVE